MTKRPAPVSRASMMVASARPTPLMDDQMPPSSSGRLRMGA